MEANCPPSPPRPKLVVEELPPDNEQKEDDDMSIKSYDAKDIAVDCGWQPCQDASGSRMDAYNAFEPEKFGYFPGSIGGDETMKKPSKTVFDKIMEHFPGSFCADVTPTFGKQIYTVSDGVSYAILTTPAGKLIRIGDKILPLKMFLRFDCIEQLGGYVQCSNYLDSKTVHSYKIAIDDLEAILLHAAAHAPSYAAQQSYVQC